MIRAAIFDMDGLMLIRSVFMGMPGCMPEG